MRSEALPEALAAGPKGIQGNTDVDITFKLIFTKHLLCIRHLLFYFSHNPAGQITIPILISQTRNRT